MKSKDLLIEKESELTAREKKLFGHFGAHSKIRPPFRILNPQRIYIGDYVSIRENAYIHAYADLTCLMAYIDERYQKDFKAGDYRYSSRVIIGDQVQIGRNLLLSCTNRVEIKSNVTISERVFIGDNNHSFSHPNVPIMQQPNKTGRSIVIARGSWVGAGASLLPGTRLGKNNVVGTNAVVEGHFPDHAVIGCEKAKTLYIKKY